MNIRGGQTRGVLFNFLTLPSVSKTTPGFTKQSRLPLRDKIRKYNFQCYPISGVFEGMEKVG